MPSVRISKADVGSFAAFCASLGETRLRRSYGGRHSQAGDSLGVADFEDDRLKRNVPDRRSSVEELHVTDAIAIDSAVGVTEYDPGDPLGRLAGLLMHPTKEANAGRPTSMGGHGSCLVNTSGDRDVVNAAGDIAGDGLVFPAAAIVGEGIQTTLAFDHIAMQEQRVVNANAVHAAFEAYSLLRPGSQGSLEWRVCIVVSIQIDESLAGKTVSTNPPASRSLAQTEADSVLMRLQRKSNRSPPHTQRSDSSIEPRDQLGMLRSIAAIAEQMQIGNEGQTLDVRSMFQCLIIPMFDEVMRFDYLRFGFFCQPSLISF